MKLLEIIKQDRSNLLRKKPVRDCKVLIQDSMGFFKPGTIYPLHLACAFKSFKVLEYLLELNVDWNKSTKNSSKKSEYPMDYFLIHLTHGVKKKEDYESFKTIFESVCRKFDGKPFPYSKNLIETICSSGLGETKTLELLKIANRDLTLSEMSFLSKVSPVMLHSLASMPESRALDAYPLLKNKFIYENVLMLFVNDGVAVLFDKFFKETSLKKACSVTFGMDSKEFMKTSLPLLISPYEAKPFEKFKELNSLCKLELFQTNQAEFLKDLQSLYLDRSKPNFNDFLLMSSMRGRKIDRAVVALFKELLKEEEVGDLLKKYLSSNTEREMAVNFADLFVSSKPIAKDKFIKFFRSRPAITRKTFSVMMKNFRKDILLMREDNYKLKAYDQCPALKKIHNKKIKDYTIKVAQTSHDLVMWGYSLNHCVGNGSFAKDMSKGRIFVLSLQKNGVDKFTVSFYPGENGSVDQAQGKSGTRPPEKIMEELEALMVKVGVFTRD